MMDDKKKIAILSILIVSVLSIGIIYPIINLSQLQNDYQYIIILPILYIIGTFIVTLFSKPNNPLIKYLILLLFAIKIYLFPILVIINGFNMRSYNYELEENITKAVFIQSIEWLTTVVCMLTINPRKNNKEKLASNKILNKNTKRITVIILLICLIGVIIWPQLTNSYHTFYFGSMAEEISWKKSAYEAHEIIPLAIYYPLTFIMRIGRILLPLFIIDAISKAKRLNNSFKLISSLLLVPLLLLLYVPDDKAGSVMSAAAMVIMLAKVYGNNRKIYRLMTIGAILMATIIAPLFANPNRINAYFSGFINTSAVFEMDEEQKTKVLLGDTLRSIPIIKGFFVDMPTTTERFNKALGLDTVYNSQIIPSEGQSYYYAGIIGVILSTFTLVKIAYSLYAKGELSNNSFTYFTYLFYSLLVAFGIVMYDNFLILSLSLQYIPLIIISKITKQEKARK